MGWCEYGFVDRSNTPLDAAARRTRICAAFRSGMSFMFRLFFGNVHRIGIDLEEQFGPAVSLVGVAGSGDFVLSAVGEFEQVVLLQR